LLSKTNTLKVSARLKDGASEKCTNNVGLGRETEKQRSDKSQKMAPREKHYLRPRFNVWDIYQKKGLRYHMF
jgi:hypothetical protein